MERLIQHMFAHIKMEVENTGISESGFTLDKIMRLRINFHSLAHFIAFNTR